MSKPAANFGQGKQCYELTPNSTNIRQIELVFLSQREKETLLCLVLSTSIESEREFLFPTVNCFPIQTHFGQQGILKDGNINFTQSCVYV